MGTPKKGDFHPLLFSLFAVQNPVKDTAVCLINLTLVKINVDVSNSIIAMSERMSDCVTRNVQRGGNSRPRVTRPIR